MHQTPPKHCLKRKCHDKSLKCVKTDDNAQKCSKSHLQNNTFHTSTRPKQGFLTQKRNFLPKKKLNETCQLMYTQKTQFFLFSLKYIKHFSLSRILQSSLNK